MAIRIFDQFKKAFSGDKPLVRPEDLAVVTSTSPGQMTPAQKAKLDVVQLASELPAEFNNYLLNEGDNNTFRVYQKDGTQGIVAVGDLDGDYICVVKFPHELTEGIAPEDLSQIDGLDLYIRQPSTGNHSPVNIMDWNYINQAFYFEFNISDSEETGAARLVEGNFIQFQLEVSVRNTAQGTHRLYNLPIHRGLRTETERIHEVVGDAPKGLTTVHVEDPVTGDGSQDNPIGFRYEDDHFGVRNVAPQGQPPVGRFRLADGQIIPDGAIGQIFVKGPDGNLVAIDLSVPPHVAHLPIVVTPHLYYLTEPSVSPATEQFFSGIPGKESVPGTGTYYGFSRGSVANNPPALNKAGQNINDVLPASSGLYAVYKIGNFVFVILQADKGTPDFLRLDATEAGVPSPQSIVPLTGTTRDLTIGGIAYKEYSGTPSATFRADSTWANAFGNNRNIHVGIQFGTGENAQYLKHDGTKSAPIVTPVGYYAGIKDKWTQVFVDSGSGLTPEQAAELEANTKARHERQTLDGLFGTTAESIEADAADINIDGGAGASEFDTQVTPWTVSAERAGVNTSEIRIAYDVRWADDVTDAPVSMTMSIQHLEQITQQNPEGWATRETFPIRPIGVGVVTFNGPFPEGSYRLRIDTVISTRGRFAAAVRIGAIDWLKDPAEVGEYIGPYVHQEIAGETTRASIAEQQLLNEVNDANRRKSIVDSLPAAVTAVKKSIQWRSDRPYQQTDADAFQVPDSGFVAFIVGNFGTTAIMPVAFCRNRQEIVYSNGNVSVGLEFGSTGKAALFARDSAARWASHEDAYNTTNGFVMLTWDVARPGGDPTRIPTLQETDVTSGNPLPLGTYELVFEMSGDGVRQPLPIPIKLLTAANKTFDVRRGGQEVGVTIRYVAATRVATWTIAGGSVDASFARHWQ